MTPIKSVLAALGVLLLAVVVIAQPLIPGTNFIRLVTGTAGVPSRSYLQDPDTGSYRIGADNEGYAAGGTLRWDYNTTRLSLSSGYSLSLSSNVITNTAPSAPSACGSSPSVSASNGTLAFNVTVGTGGAVSSCTVTMPAAAAGWNCSVVDITTQSTNIFLQKQTASTTTSVTVTNYNTAGAATVFTASDVLRLVCAAY